MEKVRDFLYTAAQMKPLTIWFTPTPRRELARVWVFLGLSWVAAQFGMFVEKAMHRMG